MSPICQLEEFSLKKLHLDFKSSEDVPVEAICASSRFDYEVGQHPENRQRFRMDLRFEYKEENATAQFTGYSITAEILGFFIFDQSESDENLAFLVRLNGVSILYGLLRGIVANSTGVFPRGKCILPTVMPREIVEHVEKGKGHGKRPKSAKK